MLANVASLLKKYGSETSHKFSPFTLRIYDPILDKKYKRNKQSQVLRNYKFVLVVQFLFNIVLFFNISRQGYWIRVLNLLVYIPLCAVIFCGRRYPALIDNLGHVIFLFKVVAYIYFQDLLFNEMLVSGEYNTRNYLGFQLTWFLFVYIFYISLMATTYFAY